MIEHIKKILHPDIWHPATKSKGAGRKWEVIIKETSDRTKTPEITLYGFPEETISFKFDAQILRHNNEGTEKWVDRPISAYFNPKAPFINKGSDAVIITKMNQCYYTIVCELKSQNLGTYQMQLLNTHLFIDYLTLLIHHFFITNTHKREVFKRCFILFKQERLRKRRSLRNKPPTSTIRTKHFDPLGSIYSIINRKENNINSFLTKK